MDTPFSFWRGMSPLNYHSPSFTRVYPVEPPLLIPLVLHPSVVANLGGLLGWRASNASGGIHNCTWWRDSTWYNLVQNGMNTMDIYGFFFPQVTESMHVLWRFEAKAEMDIRRFSCATTTGISGGPGNLTKVLQSLHSKRIQGLRSIFRWTVNPTFFDQGVCRVQICHRYP